MAYNKLGSSYNLSINLDIEITISKEEDIVKIYLFSMFTLHHHTKWDIVIHKEIKQLTKQLTNSKKKQQHKRQKRAQNSGGRKLTNTGEQKEITHTHKSINKNTLPYCH